MIFAIILAFITWPPKNWMATKISHLVHEHAEGLREPNPAWRPFVVKVSKIARRHGKEPDRANYQLGNKSIEAIFAVLSSFFTYLQQEEYLETNPVALIDKKKDIFNASKRAKSRAN